MSHLDPLSVIIDEATPNDEFERDIYTNSLRKVIESAASPLVIALYGAWGSGKTSMMLRLRDQLNLRDAVGNRLAATVWFDPWEHAGDDQPAVSLLYAIRKDLELEWDPKVREILVAIAQAIATEIHVPYLGFSIGKISDAYHKLADEDVEKRTQQAALKARFEDVMNAARAKAGNRPIVIFIDDLDRCRPATAVAILDAVKLFFSLPGCIFVLGADRAHLEAAVKAEYESLGVPTESYLDKIVQFPFTIPALAGKNVRDYIYSHTRINLWNCAPMIAAAAPDNPRQLKRLINSLTFLDHIARTSGFSQYDNHIMCALTLIQNAAPDLYVRLRHSPTDWHAVSSLGLDGEAPEWLQKMLAGSEARIQLEVALRMLPGEACKAEIINYLTLRQQVETGPVRNDQPTYAFNPLWEQSWPGEYADAEGQTPVRPEVKKLLDENLEDARFRYGEAADEGDPVGMTSLAELLQNIGRDDEAALLYQNAAEGGNADAMANLGALLESRGQTDRAEAWYRRAADEDDNTGAMASLARLLEARGDVQEAEKFYRRAAQAGDDTALPGLARLLENRGEYGEAGVWYRRAAELGSTAAMAGFGRSLERDGQFWQAENWYDRAASTGDKSAMISLAGLLERRREYEGAKEWYRGAALGGETYAMARLADLLDFLGDYSDADTWRRLLSSSLQGETEVATE